MNKAWIRLARTGQWRSLARVAELELRGTRAGRWLARHGPDWVVPRDVLTGAYRRPAIARIRPGSHLALIDVVGMWGINQAHSLHWGDMYLRAFAAGLRGVAPGARVYRIGGDEFLVEVRRLADEAEALALGARIAALAVDPLDGRGPRGGARVAVDPAPVGRDLHAALLRVDAALSSMAGAGGVVLAGGHDPEARATDQADPAGGGSP